MKPSLLKKIKNNSRSSIITQTYNKLLNKYSLNYDNDLSYFVESLKGHSSQNVWKIPINMDNNKLLLKFNDTKLTYLNFANYIVESSLINETNYKLINDLYIDFINQSIMNYYKSNLLSENQEYRYVYNEYKEGLLLFDLMESEVWNKAKDDTLGLKKYFNENKSLFNDSEMVFNIEQEIPGEVNYIFSYFGN